MYWPLDAPRVYAARKVSPTVPPKNRQDRTQKDEEEKYSALLGLRVSRNGQHFATITATSLNIWQTFPVVLLVSVIRSASSIRTYGDNSDVLLRPDSSIVAVQTSRGFLITYNISVDPSTRVFQQQRYDAKATRRSLSGRRPIENSIAGQREVLIRFRMIIKIDAGIGKALALDEELVIATEKPAAIQCIRWVTDNKTSQTSTELLNRMPWMNKKSAVVDIIYNRAMSLFVWIANDGRAYAVQRIPAGNEKSDIPKRLFRGYGFHVPEEESLFAVKASINARFSLLAIGCSNGEVHVYTARDYVGSIPLSHKLIPPVSRSTSGPITFLSYSPDGYCLFVGYANGWALWSVYGRLGGNSFFADRSISKENDDLWLSGTRDGSWIDGGSGVLFSRFGDSRLWMLEMVRSAVTGCFGPANVSRMLLHSSSTVMVYRGHDLIDLVSVSADSSLWHQAQIPAAYLLDQHPIRSAVISPDGRYIAVAGRRGLAHYSINSGRWKTFDDPDVENSFVVRGGMCWYQHILIVAVEFGEHHELRLYSREHGLNESLVFVERLTTPIVVITPTGENSLLVYTSDNNLYHYIISASSTGIQLVQVGQIGLHGIVRAPARVRAVTWYIPEHQLLDGDPSQDVVHASVLFLVDAKLVLLQPTTDDEGKLKYDMRIIASNVEYFAFIRDQGLSRNTAETPLPLSAVEENGSDDFRMDSALLDSLWYFNGISIQCWPDTQDLLKPASTEDHKDLPSPVPILVDFYPTAIALRSGVVIGIDPELVQRRDAHFAFFRFSIRTQLFLPPLLRYYLSQHDPPSALALAHAYSSLSYLPHALEILLHTVLDDEVDHPPPPSSTLLPAVLAFLAAFPAYLDILVQCTRKTEVRSWHTLFAHLPPPRELFEEALQRGMLKTAGGYLLILHTFEDGDGSAEQCVRLLRRAGEEGDWELCKELARFLMALDGEGDGLREAMRRLGLEPMARGGLERGEVLQLRAPGRVARQGSGLESGTSSRRGSSGSRSASSVAKADGGDYFTAGRL
ncbi:hypothetical protein MMC11_003937 [Xylographa trunciseda]|nr:hypothetical protein [Xylographa trunciseda]